MGASLARKGAFLDVAAIDRRYAGPHSHHPFSVFRKFGQGIGAGYFTIAGSSAVAAPSVPVDLSTVNGLAEAFFSGGLNGPLQLAGAVFLFLSAGRCLVRFAGLLLVVAAFALHAQGVTLSEIVAFASDFARRLAAAIEAFRAEPVS